ncbi:succinate-semialdehyde dehydrogenase/glutarate-semialdehyde dehydrogenase [Arthrobacter sp. V4I6]|uniref:aldehyde dehydrogenase family protein n=1 Tax=unclassified Arthrobacter TaxID=235627 RepID=UPI00277FD52F|nr:MULTISPECIES: aldehyde dehydrogenase family protein [unclassified Arthrobacter]MDQ0819542.1 succinate-semialdehyde dehydrogenase/glutarate-semialdehyde dehydrogenase [Arthrobacter sp. V1I7]MDQ0853723.1 succinate-semialdehyde dehydrogenase/glutarate-semialdehyde dehydrogenase [Arthrobacter sp. V4I6]
MSAIATAGTAFRVLNPAIGEVLAEYAEATAAEVEDAVDLARRAFAGWGPTTAERRAAVLRTAAGLLLERKENLARLATEEMGKLLGEAVAEVELCAEIFAYYAEHGPGFLADETLDYAGAVLQRRPLGPILGIMPWNYPYYQIARFAAPNLMLGNTLLIKPAPACPRSALAFEELLLDAGLPADAYRTVLAGGEQTAMMVSDPRVQGVSLTGSERAGAAVGALAGAGLKKHVLELGGSDAFIVLDSEDLDSVVGLAAAARMENAGQACTSPKRFIVAAPLYEDFVAGLAARLAAYVPGDPLDPATRLAPMSSAAAARTLLAQVEGAVAEGAALIGGGSSAAAGEAFVSPALLIGVRPGTRTYREELFGPVAVVYRAEDEDDAVRLANDSPYGLGASVFTADAGLADRIAERLEVGMVSVNRLTPSSAVLPFGEVKNSGVGRELGPLGMDEFVNRKLLVR